MHVRKDLAIAPHEDRVSRHPHVELEILTGWPFSSSARNVNVVRRFGTSGVLSRTHTIFVGGRSLCRPGAVVAGQRRALHGRGLDLSGHRLGHTGGVHEIGKQLVLARRHVRQRCSKTPGRGSRSDADATSDRAPATARTGASGGRDRERSRRGGGCRSIPDRVSVSAASRRRSARRRDQRLVDVAIVGGGLDGPPHVAEIDDRRRRPRRRSRRRCGRGAARADRASRPRRASLRCAIAETMPTNPAASSSIRNEQDDAQRRAPSRASTAAASAPAPTTCPHRDRR